MRKSTIAVLLIVSFACAHGQFWKTALNDNQSWEREMLANRESGICYKTQFVNTLDPELRHRQISFCCTGYVNRGTSKILKCEPICRPECTNGVCLSPNHCECAPGYFMAPEEGKCSRLGK